MDKKVLRLYAITDRSLASKDTICLMAERALEGGATILQLREKNVPRDFLIKEAKQLKLMCSRHGVPLIINDNVEVALKCADGVHLGKDDMAVSEVRKLAGSNFIIGATAKTVEQAVNAQAAGADYLGVGAVFPSPTKVNAIRITPQLLRDICWSVTIPAVAIGGITKDNILSLKGCGAAGAAVVSAIFGQKDIKGAAKELKRLADICFGEGV